MKYLILIICLFSSTVVSGQIKKLGKKIKKKVEQRSERKVDQTIDKGLDEIENAAEGKNETEETPKPETTPSKAQKNESDNIKIWSKYDFVPGDEIIFEDNLAEEEIGEFPSRWDLTKGNAEIAKYGNETVIYLVDDGTEVFPYMQNEEWLPDVFTIEFDAYFPGNLDFYNIRLWNTRKGYDENIHGRLNRILIRCYSGEMNDIGSDISALNSEKVWRHVAISFNKRSLKLYLDQYRVINIPNVGGKPTGFTLQGDNYGESQLFVKNIRIAKGGKKLYDRVLSEGRIVTHGIKFDLNKAKIKPESVGVINEIVKIMNQNPNLRFQIEGHTDNDGDDEFNQQLSEKRAEAVKVLMMEFGIDPKRLTTKGFGESKPMDHNDTPEGKANNRRVEFVKM